jgi:hypothetical protein
MRRSRLSLYVLLCTLFALPPALWAQVAAPAPAPAAKPAAPAVPADPQALLKVIPADATGFLAVANMKSLDDHVQGVINQLQLQGLIPSPLEWLKGATAIQGINDNGGIAVVALNAADVKTTDELADKLAILVPTTNADESIKSMNGQKDEQDPGMYKVSFAGKPSVVGVKGGFLVIAEKPAAVKGILQAKGDGIGKAMSADRVKSYTSEDVFVWANPGALSPELRKEITDGLGSLAKMGGAAATQPSGMAEGINKFIDQTQEISLALSVSAKKGLGFSYYGKAKAGSEMAAQLAAYKPLPSKALMVGLPDEPSILLVAGVGSGGNAAQTKQMDEAIGNVLKMYETLLSSAGISLEPGRLQSLKDPVVKLLSTVQQIGVNVSMLPVEGGEGRLGFTLVTKVANSTEWLGEAKKLFESVKGIAIDAAKKHGTPEDQLKTVTDSIQWKENAEKIEGARVDHFVIDIDKLTTLEGDKGEEAKAGVEKAKTFLGKEGVIIRVAAVDDKTVVVTFGGGAKRAGDVVKLAKSGGAPLADSKEVKMLADRLPAGPKVVEAYINIENLLNLVTSTMAQFGQTMPIPLSLKNSAPIAFAVTKVGDSAQETQILVPMELIGAVKDAIGPMLMMFGGGGPGGGGMPGMEPGTQPKGPGGELN